MSERKNVRLAITLGDPRGIGPEIAGAAINDPTVRDSCTFVLVGPSGAGVDVDVSIGDWSPDLAAPAELEDADRRATALAGRLSGLAIEEAVRMAQAGEVDGIVTGPIDKSALWDGGYNFPGHTEMLAALTGSQVSMMLASDRLRVVLATTHIALRDVVDNLTVQSLISSVETTRKGLQEWFGIDNPRIALCGINPHLGDSGRFGDEDQTVLAPAARESGAMGPYSADTIFVRAMRGEFDAVIAPYHDVGMTAIKVASFGSAFNVTLGLPFPRTSPDHGTAIDIAGKGIADPSSFKGAILECVTIATKLKSRRHRC